MIDVVNSRFNKLISVIMAIRFDKLGEYAQEGKSSEQKERERARNQANEHWTQIVMKWDLFAFLIQLEINNNCVWNRDCVVLSCIEYIWSINWMRRNRISIGWFYIHHCLFSFPVFMLYIPLVVCLKASNTTKRNYCIQENIKDD